MSLAGPAHASRVEAANALNFFAICLGNFQPWAPAIECEVCRTLYLHLQCNLPTAFEFKFFAHFNFEALRLDPYLLSITASHNTVGLVLCYRHHLYAEE